LASDLKNVDQSSLTAFSKFSRKIGWTTEKSKMVCAWSSRKLPSEQALAKSDGLEKLFG
jgi:hypothetical protein